VKAEARILRSVRTSPKRQLRLHLAKRRNLFAKAVAQGDTRAALACLDSEAKLLDLYPARKLAVKDEGDDTGPSLTAILTVIMEKAREEREKAEREAKEVQAVQAVTPTPQLTMTSSTETPHVAVEAPTAGPDAPADAEREAGQK
jgi:hypothetical protein